MSIARSRLGFVAFSTALMLAATQTAAQYGSAPSERFNPAIWIDPDGCDNWVIDDGAEGYMMRRRDPKTGLPVCSGIAPPGYTSGDFKGGSPIPDAI